MPEEVWGLEVPERLVLESSRLVDGLLEVAAYVLCVAEIDGI